MKKEVFMKGSVGISVGVYGSILPGAVRLARIQSLSKSKLVKNRLKWIDYYLKIKNARLVCRHFGICPSLFYKWLKRFKHLGIKGLENSSKKPMRFRQSKIPIKHIDIVRRLRILNPCFSKYKLRFILLRDYSIDLSYSTVGRIIKDYDLFFKHKYKSKKERYKYNRNRLPKDFKVSNPGDLVQSDTKHISFFGPKRYFYVITDCMTKITSIRVSSSISSRQSQLAFECARKHFPYKIKNSQNDNGSENLKELRNYLKEKEINQYFIRPRTPKDNSFVERMIGTIEREFIQQGNLTFDIKEQQELIDKWLNKYHTYRPHQSLNYLTPYEYYEKIKNKR
jgi:putative transposase